jgi:SAM-dependent methyltransferase
MADMDGREYNNEAYYAHIYALSDSENQAIYRSMAEEIVRTVGPKSVLDAGCAVGYLVSGFRDIGVDAWGIDISEYAISQGREEHKPYLRAQSVFDPLPEQFPQSFDMVVSLEVAEHLPEELADSFIGRLCELADTVVFSSSPYDLKDKTHYNVQQAEYWCKRFAAHGFFRCMDKSFSVLPAWSICFSKRQMDAVSLVDAYECRERILSCEWEESKMKLESEREELKKKLEEENGRLKRELAGQETANKQLREECETLSRKYNEIANAAWWKATAPARRLVDLVRSLCGR